MNAITRFPTKLPTLPTDAPKFSRPAYRAACALGHEIFTTRQTIELDGAKGFGATIECEVDFYRSADAIPGNYDEPGEPVQYDIAEVRPYICAKLPTGFKGTTPTYLECPDWLADVLMDCVDPDSLNEDHQ